MSSEIDLVFSPEPEKEPYDSSDWRYYAVDWQRCVTFWPKEVESFLLTNAKREAYGMGHLSMFTYDTGSNLLNFFRAGIPLAILVRVSYLVCIIDLM